MTGSELYAGREQTLVKHRILRRYLQRFAHIIGFRWASITYVDCFSGPWKSQSEEFADTSFAIAVEELRNARQNLSQKHGREVKLRCFFLEKSKRAYKQLTQFAEQFDDVEIKTLNAELKDAIGEIRTYVQAARPKTFPFIFIDPTGWSGFALDTIEPLLRLRPGEALINFMTKDIRRFIESPERQTRETFKRLFGSEDFRQRLAGLVGRQREDAAVLEYMSRVKGAGRFELASSAVVLHPEISASHFHLIYLSRHPRGLEVFKDAEKAAMSEMERERAKLQQKKREKKTGYRELFRDEEGTESRYFAELREHYLSIAQKKVRERLRSKVRLPYDSIWVEAVSHPMVWESDLKNWIKQWKSDGLVAIEGLAPRSRVPHREAGHRLVWTGSTK